MGFSYSGDPLASMLDAVRFDIDDTDQADYRFEDAEILAVLAKNGIPDGRAAKGDLTQTVMTANDLRRIMVRRQDQDPSFKLGSFSEDRTAAAKLAWEKQMYEQRRLAARAPMYAGGISIADKDAARADPDRPADSIFVGMMDFPGTPANVVPEKPGQG